MSLIIGIVPDRRRRFARGTIGVVNAAIEREAPNLQETAGASRYNFIAGVIDAAGWPLGMAFFSTTTLLPVFLLHLHASYLEIGLLPALINLGYLLPGMGTASRVSRMRYVRPSLALIGMIERFPLFVLAALVWRLGPSHPAVLLASFYTIFLGHAVATGINQPAYWSLIAKQIPARRRGRMFGMGGLIGGLLGLGVDPVTRFFLARARPGSLDGYAGCFFVASLIILLSFLPLSTMRETPGIPDEGRAPGPHWRDASRVWRSDAGFRRLILVMLAVSAWTAAPPFFLAAVDKNLHVGPGAIALYTSVNVVSLALGNAVWGAWADRAGNRRVLIVAASLIVAGTDLALAPIGATAYQAVFALTALGNGGMAVAGYNMALEFAPTQSEVSFYLATLNGIMAAVRAAAPLVGGAIAMRLGFSWLFASAAVCAAAALALTFVLPEPRKRASLRTAL